MKESEFALHDPEDLIDLGYQNISPVAKKFIEGDTEGKLVFELTIGDLPLTPYEDVIIRKGARVFYSANRKALVIHSEESLRWVNESKPEKIFLMEHKLTSPPGKSSPYLQ